MALEKPSDSVETSSRPQSKVLAMLASVGIMIGAADAVAQRAPNEAEQTLRANVEAGLRADLDVLNQIPPAERARFAAEFNTWAEGKDFLRIMEELRTMHVIRELGIIITANVIGGTVRVEETENSMNISMGGIGGDAEKAALVSRLDRDIRELLTREESPEGRDACADTMLKAVGARAEKMSQGVTITAETPAEATKKGAEAVGVVLVRAAKAEGADRYVELKALEAALGKSGIPFGYTAELLK